MNTIIKILVIFLCVNSVKAQNGYQKNNTQQHSKYNPETVITVDAEIISVKEIEHSFGKSTGIHLEIKSPGLQMVHVGPSWYVNEQPVRLAVGDKVTITGSKITSEGQAVLIAKEIKKGSESLQLRSEDGTPLWVGRGKRKK